MKQAVSFDVFIGETAGFDICYFQQLRLSTEDY